MRLVSFWLLAVLSLGMGGYAVYTYGFRQLGVGVHPDMQGAYELRPAVVYAHVFGALVALLVGPFQFLPRLRAARPGLHRILGRLYLGVGVLVGGAAGLWVSTFAFGGIAGRLGFGCLAVVWLYTGARALLAIRQRNVAAHRRWMIRNFALTFSAVTFRFWMVSLVFGGLGFGLGYPIATWLCWVPNLLVAELLIRRDYHKVNPPSTTSVAPVM